MGKILIILTCFVLLGVSTVFGASTQLQIDYNKVGVPTADGKQNISGWVTLLSEETVNLKGVIVVFDSDQITVDNRNSDFNHDGFYNGKPFWNLGNVIARGGGTAELKFQVPAGATQVTLTASIYNSVAAPVVDAGDDKVSETGRSVVLDGSRTFDPDGNKLSYKWTIKVKPTSSNLTDDDIKNASTPIPFFVPDAEGRYEIGLDVSDGTNLSADIVAIDVTDFTQSDPAPHADAGPDQFGVVAKQLKFDGRKSFDMKDDSLTYTWSFIVKPKDSTITNINFDTHSVAGMCIFTPDVPGKYILHLKVGDPGGKWTTSTVKALVLAADGNLPPTANCGTNQDVFTGKVVLLDGSLSSDPENSPLTYQWLLLEKPSGSAASLSSDSEVTPAFTPDAVGVYKVMLTVNDGVFESLPAILQFTVFDQDSGVVGAGTEQTVADAFKAIEPVDGSSLLTVSSPFPGAVYPTNVQPKLAWTFTGGPVDGSKIVLSYSVNGEPKSAIFIVADNFYIPSSTIWAELAGADQSGAVSFAVFVKSGSSVYASQSVSFNITNSKISGQIVFWGVGAGGSNIYSLNPQGTSLATPIYGDLTGNGCAGCHAVSSAGDLAVNDYGPEGGMTRVGIVSMSNPQAGSTDVVGAWSSVVSWSADGSKLLYTFNRDIYVYDKLTGSKTPVVGLSRPDRDEVMGTYAPDGSIVAVVAPAGTINAFSFFTNELTQIVRLKTDGTEQVIAAAPAGSIVYYPSVSPNGKWVVFNQSTDSTYSSGTSKLFLVSLDASAAPKELTIANGNYQDATGGTIAYGNSWPTWAPDSSWVAFSSNRPILGAEGQSLLDWSLFTTMIDPDGNDSVAVPIPGASSPGMGEHIPSWTN